MGVVFYFTFFKTKKIKFYLKSMVEPEFHFDILIDTKNKINKQL